MSSTYLFLRHLCLWHLFLRFAIGSLLALSVSDLAEAQIVRRFPGGGVQIRAPFVRVNVGPYGGTSVRAPFVAIDSGQTYVGRGRRLMAQPGYGAPPQRSAYSEQAPTPPRTTTHGVPETADVDALPYPTASDLAAMNDTVLVETLRQMTARLHYRLSLLNTGEGWQNYLILNRDILGSPGAPPEAAQFDAVQKMLPRYRSVQDDPRFVKISALPSFVATFAALQETDRRFGVSVSSPSESRTENNGPTITDPNSGQSAPIEGPTEKLPEEPQERLPTPQSVAVPNATRGERSILKRQ